MRKRRNMTWQEIVYGVIILGLILWMLIYASINGRSTETTEFIVKSLLR